MATRPPQFLTLAEHRDGGHPIEKVARRLVVTLLAATAVAALAGVFGQRATPSEAAGGGATLEVDAPTRLRGGLFFQGRFTIAAASRERGIDDAVLVLDRGWLESMHVNTIEPAPLGEASRNGRLALDLGHVPAGERLVLYAQFQVNPTNVGRLPQGVELYDGGTRLVRVERTVTIFP